MISTMRYPFECTLCDTKTREVVKGKVKKTSEYHEVDVQLSNLSTMKVAVCSKHVKPKKSDLPIIMEKTKLGWLEEISLGVGDESWFREIGSNLNVVKVV